MSKTPDELIKCAEREIAMRKRVYALHVGSGRMKQETADHEIECMQEILQIVIGHKDRLVPMLFESAS